MCCLFTLRKTNTSRLSHSKNCNKSSMRKCVKCLFFSMWTDNTFSHAKFITIFRFSMRKCVVCSHWEKQTFQGYPILKIVINLVWQYVLSVHTEKNKHFKVSPCEQTTHFLMLNLLQFLEWGNLEVFFFLSVNRQHILSC
jgi:hypothetical protein